MQEFEYLWQEVLDKLHETYDTEIYDELFEPLSGVVKFSDNYIYVITPSPYVQSRINRLYLTKINSIAQSLYKKSLIGFKFVLEEEIKKEPVFNGPESNLEFKYRAGDLNATLSFNNFVVGKSNRFAFQMAVKVADQPGAVVNPLYIFGDVGLGKTHLMQAIGNYIYDNNIASRVLYVKASEFLESYVTKVRNQEMDIFNEKFKNVDILLVDDIQQLSGNKGNTQTEFFKIFDHIVERNKQIVITSDKPANELNMMDRLKSRFQQGLVVDIDIPDLEHRVEILRRKFEVIAPPEMEDISINVLEFIATYFTTNIRELEGALNRVIHYCLMNNSAITIAKAEEALDSLIQTKRKTDQLSENNYDKIQSVVAEYYSVSVHDLIGPSRKTIYTLPRHIAMYLIKETYDLPYKTIGSFFNNRDHSTVLNAVDKIVNQRKHDRELNLAIEHIIKKLDK